MDRRRKGDKHAQERVLDGCGEHGHVRSTRQTSRACLDGTTRSFLASSISVARLVLGGAKLVPLPPFRSDSSKRVRERRCTHTDG